MHVLLSTILALTALASAANAQPTPAASPWKPVPGHIMTKWAADVTPEKVWPEYPRPQMARDKWLNLNGLWDYSLTGPKREAISGQILVPFPVESALSGVGKTLDPAGLLRYKRSFAIPADWKGQRLLLQFGAVDWKAVIRVNGKYIGQHTGGYEPFTFDITHAAAPGNNEIIVEVTDPTDTTGQPIGKQRLKPEGIWYTATSGIWQTVWIEPVPQAFIKSMTWATTSVSEKGASTTLDVEVDSHEDGDVIKVAVLDDDKEFAWNTARCDSCDSHFSLVMLMTHESGHYRLWSPEDPFTYGLNVKLVRAGRVIDQVTSYAAVREVKIAKDQSGINRLMLNGKPTFQFGPLDQGFWPDGIYTPPTDEAMKQDILAVKKMGGNMLRKHVKVEPDRFYYWCDKLGIMVWQDMPSIFPPKEAAAAGLDWKKNFEDELHRMIVALKNHPSIIMWVPFNEGWGQHDTADIVALVHQWDPSRLINNASGWTDMHVGDVVDLHDYPGPGMPPAESTRAAVLGEFGGLGLPLEGHTWVDKNNWGYVSFKNKSELTDAYVKLIDRIPALIAQGLCAAVYTQTTDCEIECNGWLTYDRAIWKIDADRAAAATKKLYGPPPVLNTILPTAATSPRDWRFTVEKPADAWASPDFDDSAWPTGKSGFGSRGTPGAILGTEWKSSDIWIRSHFDLAEADFKDPQLLIHHDEDAEVYINGQLAVRLTGYTTGYAMEPLSAQAAKLLKKGPNSIAIHCHQTTGGQYIDAGLVDVSTGVP